MPAGKPFSAFTPATKWRTQFCTGRFGMGLRSLLQGYRIRGFRKWNAEYVKPERLPECTCKALGYMKAIAR
jgi:hypothetical protein